MKLYEKRAIRIALKHEIYPLDKLEEEVRESFYILGTKRKTVRNLKYRQKFFALVLIKAGFEVKKIEGKLYVFNKKHKP